MKDSKLCEFYVIFMSNLRIFTVFSLKDRFRGPVNDNPDLVDAIVAGMGGMGMGMGGAYRRDHANSAHNLLMVRV